MTKKLDHSKKAKEDFKSPLIDFLKENRTRQECAQFIKATDKTVREEVRQIALYYPVISHSGKLGYRLAKDLTNLSAAEIEAEIIEVNKSIYDLYSRVISLKNRLKPLIDYRDAAKRAYKDRLAAAADQDQDKQAS